MTRTAEDEVREIFQGLGLPFRPPPAVVQVLTCACGQKNRVTPGRAGALCGRCRKPLPPAAP